VIAYDSYAKSRHTNELSVLQQLAGDPDVNVHVVEHGPGHAVYRVNRQACPAT
jgi:hypothetical protein